MWILRYEYDLENGEINKNSCCLKHDEEYSVGRSGKNLLNVKNDKSISRQHVTVSWSSRDYTLTLVNQGKMTAAFSKYLKIGEPITFEKSQKKAVLKLGTKPLKVELEWIDTVWLVPVDYMSLSTPLRELGIELLSSGLNNVTLMAIGENGNYSQILYGLAKRIPFVKPEFLNFFEKTITTQATEFDTIWPSVLNDQCFSCNKWDIPENPLKNLEFYAIDNDNEASIAIEAAGGKYSKFLGVKELQEELTKKENTDNIVILRQVNVSTKDLGQLGKNFNMKDVVEAVLHDKIDALKKGVAKPIMKRQESGAPVEKPLTKRRRLNRPRVKPLDILSFFAGGESIKESQVDSTIKLDYQDSVPIEGPSEPNSKSKKDLVEVQKKLTEKPEGHESYNIPEKKEEPIVQTTSIKPIALERASAPLLQTKTKIQAPGHDTVFVPENVSSAKESNSIPLPRKPTLNDYKISDSSTQDDMVQMIQATKSREVKRLNSSIIQVGEEELTEDAINQLGNLVLIDQNDELLRRRVESPTVDSHNPDWNNRKNFKNFVKIWPRYRRRENTNSEGSSDTIRNRAFLLTRQYVPTRTYTGSESPIRVNENLYDFPESQNKEPQPEGPVPNNLFVMDEEDSEDVVLEEPPKNTMPSPSLSHLINTNNNVDANDDSDDDDDEPKFQFKRRR